MAPKGAQGSSAKGAQEGSAGASSSGSASGLALIPETGALGKKAAQAVMDRLKALAKKGNPVPITEYKRLGSASEKRGFALRLKLDPEAAFCEVKETTGASSINKEKCLHGELALWEIAKIEGIPYNPEDTKTFSVLEALVADLPNRPHPNKKLAAEGHKVYSFEKRLASEGQSRKTRTIEAKKSKEVNNDEWEQTAGVIDNESPCPPVFGRIPGGAGEGNKRKLTEDQKAEKKKKLLDDEKRKKEEFQAMSPSEKKEFLDEEKKQKWLKDMKRVESLLNTGISKAASLSGHLASMKESKWVSPKRLNKALSDEVAELKKGLELVHKHKGLGERLSGAALQAKKFQDVIAKADEILTKWDSFKREVAKVTEG